MSAKAKPKGQHGGARPGAGRKPKAERYSKEIQQAEDRCRDHLPRTIENLEALADGTAPRVEEEYAAASTIKIDVEVLDDAGQPRFLPSGRPMMVKKQAFPHLDPDAMVLVKKKVITEGPEFRANEYLADRVLGKPTAAVEVSGPEGGPVEKVVFYLPNNGRDGDQGQADPAQQ